MKHDPMEQTARPGPRPAEDGDAPVLEAAAPASGRTGGARCLLCGHRKAPAQATCGRCGESMAVHWLQRMHAGRRAGWFRELVRGGWFFFRGLGFMWTHKGLWLYVILPIAINIVVFLGIVGGGLILLHGPIHAMFEGQAWWQQTIEWAAEAAAALALLLLLFFLFTAVGTLIGAPFNEALAEKVEAIAVGSAHEEKFSLRRDVLVPLIEAVKLLSIQGVTMLALLLLWLIPVVGAVPSVLAMAWFAALDFVDPTMERKRYRTGEKLGFMWKNKSLCLGFGAVCYLMLMVPLLQLMVIPVGVVGGTLMYLAAREKC